MEYVDEVEVEVGMGKMMWMATTRLGAAFYVRVR